MPKITINITHAEMLQTLEDAQLQLADSLTVIQSHGEEGCDIAKATVPDFEALTTALVVGIANIHAQIEQLYEAVVPKANRQYVEMARKMAACNEPDCDLSVEFQAWLLENDVDDEEAAD